MTNIVMIKPVICDKVELMLDLKDGKDKPAFLQDDIWALLNSVKLYLMFVVCH